MKALLKLHTPPTAVFVTNYEMTLGAMIALNETGLTVPDDSSLIGFDKLDLFGAMFSNLTLVKQPQNAIGECVARQLLHMLSKTSEQSHCQIITLSAQLKEGSSVKKQNMKEEQKPQAVKLV